MTLGTLSRPDGQVLLVPIMIELDPRELDFLLSNQNVIEASGIFFELFGSNAINITEVPQFFEKENLRSLLNQILDDLQQHAPSKSAKTLTQDIIAKSIAKKTAMIKKASSESFTPLLKQLFSCKLPYCAPNGQPTMFQTSLNELKNRFK